MAKGDGTKPCIVYNGRGAQAVEAYPGTPAAGVLRLAYAEVTVFPNRGAALAAMARTRRYVRINELPWDTSYRIARLVPPPAPRAAKRKEKGTYANQ